MNTAPMPLVVPPAEGGGGEAVCWMGPDGTILVLSEGGGERVLYRSTDATQRDREALDEYLAEIGVNEFKSDEMHIIGDTGIILHVSRLSL